MQIALFYGLNLDMATGTKTHCLLLLDIMNVNNQSILIM